MKSNLHRLRIAGKNLKRYPRNIDDMFYRNYLDAEADLMFKELLGNRSMVSQKRRYLNKKVRKCGNVLVMGGDLFKQYNSLR